MWLRVSEISMATWPHSCGPVAGQIIVVENEGGRSLFT